MTATQPDHTAPEAGVDIFVARQPIFRRDLQVHGYELLYRGSPENTFDGTMRDVATARVIANVFLTIGAEQLLNGKIAFINFDATLLTLEYAALLPSRSAVVEILEDTEPADNVLAACHSLKQHGYTLALDDSTSADRLTPWLGLVDIVKVDWRATSEEARAEILAVCRRHKIRVLAEKLETQPEFDAAAAEGYDYFQGYFFARPVVHKGRAMPEAKLVLLQLLREVSREDLDFDAVEKLLQRNVALVYKLLRYVNSPLFAWQCKIKSVRHALALLGQQELRKWICLLLVAGLGEGAVPELLVRSLVRARFAELLSPKMRLGARKASAFLLGLLSHLDVLLRCPMDEALSGLKLEDDLANALLSHSAPKDTLGRLYSLIQAYEAADPDRLLPIASDCRIATSDLRDAYVKAVAWADAASAA